jgi:hypothetical protein
MLECMYVLWLEVILIFKIHFFMQKLSKFEVEAEARLAQLPQYAY